MTAWLNRAFTNHKAREFYVMNDVLAFFTILSTISLILETVPSLQTYLFWFNAIEIVAAIVFTLEYIARLWVTKPWYRYSFSFYGIIDLVSIVPTFLGVANLTFLKSVRIVRLVRFLRLVRLAKLSRLSSKEIEHSVGVLGMNVGIYTACLLTALVVFGTALYLVEPENELFLSIPAAMWWSFQVFMGGIPVSVPATELGEVLYVFARFSGLLLFGVLIGVVGNIFRVIILNRR